MFSYYGGKGRIASWYPAPRYPLVIEPFAGAAWYSVKRNLTGVSWLYDVNPIIQAVWDWVLHRATRNDIFTAPTPTPRTPMLRHTDAGFDYFYRFWGNQGSETPRNVAGSLTGCRNTFHTDSWREMMWSRIHAAQARWRFFPASYLTCPDIEATWFIDPPYSLQSCYKGCAPLDYQQLADWCRARRGQVIVCESEGATWLPFRLLKPGACVGQRKTSKLRTEVVWMSDVT